MNELALEHDQDVAEIGQAFELLSPLLGLGIASILFAIALLASGLNSTVTATLAGQIVMEGFLRLRIPNWARRLLTQTLRARQGLSRLKAWLSCRTSISRQ